MRALRRVFAAWLIVTALLSSVVTSHGQANPQDMLTLMRRITALAQEGRYGEAVGLARKLATDAERASGPQSPLTAMTLIVLGQALQAQGEGSEAKRCCDGRLPFARRRSAQIIRTLPRCCPRSVRSRSARTG